MTSETDIASTVAATAAAVTGSETPDAVKVTRPTRQSESTLFAALGALCAFAAILIAILAFLHWPERTAAQRIWFLGWMGLLSVGGILLIVVAIASPWLGRVEAQAGAGRLIVEGRS
jgi:H+/Cl- antiporter ClcA